MPLLIFAIFGLETIFMVFFETCICWKIVVDWRGTIARRTCCSGSFVEVQGDERVPAMAGRYDRVHVDDIIINQSHHT